MAAVKSAGELLELRQKLMASNKREVESLLKEAQRTIDTLRQEKESEVRSLTVLLDATRGQLQSAINRLKATESALAETERTTEVRIYALQRELETTRSELAQLGDSMKALNAAHRRAHDTIEETAARKEEAKRRERELELEQIRLTDLSSSQQRKIGELTEELQRAQEKVSSITASWLQGQRDMSSVQQRLSVAESSKAIGSSRQVERLSETVRLLELNNKRLLRIIAQVGLSGCDADSSSSLGDERALRRQAEELRNIQAVFRLVRATGNGKYQFLGDSALHDAFAGHGALGGTAVRSSADPTVLQDLRTCVTEHNTLVDARNELSSLRGDVGATSGGFDPVVRLRTERDFWIPMPIVAAVSDFRARYFPNQAADVFYALLVELSRLFREHCNLSVTDAATRSYEAASREATSEVAAPGQQAPGLVRTHAALDVKDIAQDLFAVDAVRCISGLRSLIAQTEKICGSGAIFQSLPAHTVREILASSLRTVESLVARCRRLEHEHCVHEAARKDAHDGSKRTGQKKSGSWPCGAAVCVERVESLMDDRLRKAILLCTEGIGEANAAGSTARGYLRAPQDPHDPDAPPNAKCPVLTPFFVRGLNDMIRRHETREVQTFRRIHDLLLALRKDASDERARALTGDPCSARQS